MKTQPIEFIISRFQPGRIDPPRNQSFFLEVDETTTVLDALERIRRTQDPTLVYRHSCHHSSCGTCACRINGPERLACTTRVGDLKTTGWVTLEPLNGFKRIADLAVDMTSFYRDIDPQWSYLKLSEPFPGSESLPGSEAPVRFEECIECGACVSACPSVQEHGPFMGPAALAALHNELLKNPDAQERLLAVAGGERGERWCQRWLACSRVCPTRVYPAHHIVKLTRFTS
jgi:succinate dehydrogenase / fumarate reductase, iron-sulfur subunit